MAGIGECTVGLLLSEDDMEWRRSKGVLRTSGRGTVSNIVLLI